MHWDYRCKLPSDYIAVCDSSRRDKRLWKCPRKANTTRYCRGEEKDGEREREKLSVHCIPDCLERGG